MFARKKHTSPIFATNCRRPRKQNFPLTPTSPTTVCAYLSEMTLCTRLLPLAIFLAVVAGPRWLRADESLAASTAIVFNSASSDSAALAKFYAQKRGIVRDHLVGLDCPLEEEISREQYDAKIAEPLRATFQKRHWWTLR